MPRALGALPARHRGDGFTLVHGDSLELMRQIPGESVDLVFADPPYFLSNGGTTCSGGERVAVDKGGWDESRGLDADHAFQRAWLAECQRVLKPSGTLWASGTHHCIFSVGFAAQQLRYHVLNLVTWFKPNASPNLSCRMLTHSSELVMWAAPAEHEPQLHTFHYDVLRAENDGKQLRDVWEIPVTPPSEKIHGEHPTSKPLTLLRRIMKTAANAGDLVLDPFNGSGTTGVAAIEAGCRYLGIDINADYLDLTARRIGAISKP